MLHTTRVTRSRRVRSVLLSLALVASACTNGEQVAPPAKRLDPTTVPQFVQPLDIPPVMPPSGMDGDTTEYAIEARQLRQQILPQPMPTTVVWGYGRAGDPLPGGGEASTFHYPGYTVEARQGHPVRVTWVNGLKDGQGRFLSHLLPVDRTIHAADPVHAGHGGDTGDGNGRSPVPIVTHVHGARTFDHSDGHPDAWFLPDAVDIPEGVDRRGPFYHSQRDVGEGGAVFEYPLGEQAGTFWYHDHALGVTRINVYAGLAGFWIVRDDTDDALGLPGPAPRLGDAAGARHYEIPIAIQDRSFRTDGSLFYPSSRAEFGDTQGPFAPDSEIPPVWNPEVFGDVMVANGRAWPYLEVEPRLYRFRLLNGCDSRFLILGLDHGELEMVQIGGDDGFLPDGPAPTSELPLGPAERADVLIDFTSLQEGEVVTLLNLGPDEPWRGPDATPPQEPADPATTGHILQFRVVAPTSDGTRGAVPATLPAQASATSALPPRDLALFERTADGVPTHLMLGTVADGPLAWSAPATEVVHVDDTEIWRVANLTADAHPIHLHLEHFRVLDRIPFDSEAFSAAEEAWLSGEGPMPSLDAFTTGAPIPPPVRESGEKDTVMMLPGTITRIIATFDRAGQFVWHCHVLEHEDNEMMRPLIVLP